MCLQSKGILFNSNMKDNSSDYIYDYANQKGTKDKKIPSNYTCKTAHAVN
jgi:hypothetical protein